MATTFHNRKKAFKLLTYFMGEELMTVPSNATSFCSWRESFVENAETSFTSLKQVLHKYNIGEEQKRDKLTVTFLKQKHSAIMDALKKENTT